MKRSLLIATALVLCASSAASAQDKVKKDKDRDRPAPVQPAQPAPRPQPAPRVQAAPAVQRQERPAFQPQTRPAPQPSVQQPSRPPAARPERADRPDRDRPDARPRPDRAAPPERVDRPARAERPDRPPQDGARDNRQERPDRSPRVERPDVSTRPDRADRPRPAPQPRPEVKVRPGHPPRAPRPPIAERGPAKVKPSRAALPTRPDRARRSQRPASPAAVARSRAIHQALRADRRKTFQFRGRTFNAFKVRPYRYPSGWRYRAWRKHQRFPVELFLSSWVLNDFLNYGLYAPQPGYRWVRYGPDAVLVDTSSYDIADTAYGVFDDGSAYNRYDDADLPPIDSDLPQAFADGSLDLAEATDQSDACGFFYNDRQTQDDIDAAWYDQDWNGLAKTVIWAGCGNDVSYYLLGLAAEGLALPDAAANYFGRALDLADGDADSTFKCAASGPDTCRGLDIGTEASNGLDRIYGPAQ